MCDEFVTHLEFHCIEERLQNAERVLTVANICRNTNRLRGIWFVSL